MKKLILAVMALVCVYLTSCSKDEEHFEMSIYQSCEVPSGTTLNGKVHETPQEIIYGVSEEGYGVCFKKYLDDNNQPVIEREGKYMKVSEWGRRASSAEVSGGTGLLWKNVTYKHLEYYKFHVQLIEVQQEQTKETESSEK